MTKKIHNKQAISHEIYSLHFNFKLKILKTQKIFLQNRKYQHIFPLKRKTQLLNRESSNNITCYFVRNVTRNENFFLLKNQNIEPCWFYFIL